MARILAPNKEYAGVSAGISFTGGEGYTDNEYLIGWFRGHGYEVSDENEPDQGGRPEEIAPAQMEGKKPARRRSARKE